jgi:starch phosphorylase
MQSIAKRKDFTDPQILINFEYQMSPREKFEVLLNNFWFTWNPHHILPIIDLYGDGWRKNSPPEALMANYGKEKLSQLLQSKNWELDQNLRLFDTYLSSNDGFIELIKSEDKFKIFETKPIAYFCLEYGFVDWLQIYSGGLGILAGDYIKQASDSGLPVIGIGIFYHQGYLHQDFSPDGMQLESYIHQDPLDYNMSIAKDKDGKEIVIDLPMGGTIVKIRAWKQLVGKSVMYLLDTNFEDNKEWEDRLITGYLYGGDVENRIRQEIVLGIGGAKLLERLEITPSIFHMNEGHSGFLIFERIRQIMKEKGLSFDKALAEEKTNLIFTNHTLKQAGNDIFDFLLFEKYLSAYANEMGININSMFVLGDDQTYSQGGFSMTVFCMRNATICNSVSVLHGNAAKNIWKDYELVPVTNGVHLPTWISPEIHAILDKYLGEKWHYSTKLVDLEKIDKIPSDLLWQAHMIRKNKLIHSLNTVLGLNLKPEVLTIAWSRRLTAYKRPDLIITDIERLKSIVSNSERPIQILIAGKSHPKDTIGKQLLQKINQSFSDDFFKNRIEVIPGYNWQLARRIVSGTDIWLNTPHRYEEACGTSGMKAAANGVIQFTTLDGWTDEVDWYKIGWVIDEDDPSQSLYNYLENNIAPLYYSKNANGFNEDWIIMMKNSIKLILRDFSSERMLDDYLIKIYKNIL